LLTHTEMIAVYCDYNLGFSL